MSKQNETIEWEDSDGETHELPIEVYEYDGEGNPVDYDVDEEQVDDDLLEAYYESLEMDAHFDHCDRVTRRAESGWAQ